MAGAVTVAMRVDASLQIGMGHFQRCLTLADVLHGRGVHTSFICRALPQQLADTLQRRGHMLRRLPGEPRDELEDAQQTCAVLEPDRLDWLVVDHYGIDARWEQAVRPRSQRILVIDDLADRPHDCEALLDQNYCAEPSGRYSQRVPAGCRLLLGPRYALLRPEFAQLRDRLPERTGTVARLLVFFGAGDAGNYTQLALDALADVGRPDLAVDVVTGLMNPHRREIAELCAGRPGTRHFHDVDDMARLMAGADLALGAGGSNAWERCCLGLPTLALAVADNQQRVVEELCAAGVVLSPACDPQPRPQLRNEFAALLSAMLASPQLLRGMARRARALVDGRGAQRVAAVLLSAKLIIREATESDRRQIFEWRNHPEVRRLSRDPAAIGWETHVKWYAETLHNPDRALLIAESAGRPVAVVRFDISADSAEVSVYLVPDELAGGWGAQALSCAAQWLRQRRPQVRQILAIVLPANLASRGAFTNAGFRERSIIFHQELD
jgi:UDP-2,4-diacetamido-2,4,6-trideoxy-beta-L-altropyranose hydrolase